MVKVDEFNAWMDRHRKGTSKQNKPDLDKAWNQVMMEV